MDAEQYDIMAEAEERHWWYLGLRDAIRCNLAQPALRQPLNPCVLDAGCGTGANLRFLSELLRPAYLAGFDVTERALAFARCKCPQADIYLSDIRKPELRRSSFDLIVCCDVLYVPGIASSLAGVKQLIAALKPGGIFILGLPAYQWLRSAHDTVVHTHERYVLSQIQTLFSELQLRPVRMSYRLCSLLPVLVVKRLRTLGSAPKAATVSELRQPANWLNRLLYLNLHWENKLISRGVRLPFGSSIFCIGRK